jgi:hypothetical protein
MNERQRMENPGDGGLRSSLLTGRLTEKNERGVRWWCEMVASARRKLQMARRCSQVGLFSKHLRTEATELAPNCAQGHVHLGLEAWLLGNLAGLG